MSVCQEEQAHYADQYFEETIYPVLTPMAMDSSRPFPLIRNKTLNIGALISKKGEKGRAEFATVQVPVSIAADYPASGRTEREKVCDIA